MNVVISIGGSVLAPDLGASAVRDHADVVESLAADGHDLGVVVGGGTVAREYIGTARELGANEIELDQLGIEVTRLNARLLISALRDNTDVVSAPPEDYEAAGHAMRSGELAVMGGVAPAQTTDAVSAALAEYVDADLLVYATSVPGVFDADPNVDPDAERYDRLAASDLVDLIADLEMEAGASAPIDLVAAKVIQGADLRTIVVDGSDPERIARAVRGEDVEGTDVVPDEAATAEGP
jgi:uridylate kinase